MAKRSTVLLLAGYVGALAFIAYELQYKPALTPLSPARTSVPLPRLAPPAFAPGKPDDYSALVERPPFIRGRRGIAQAPEPAEPTTDPRPGNLTAARLSAILVNGNKITAVVENGDGSSTRLQKGKRFEGWQVNDIRPDRVILHLDNQRRELLVHRFGKRPPPTDRAARPSIKQPEARRVAPRRRRLGAPR